MRHFLFRCGVGRRSRAPPCTRLSCRCSAALFRGSRRIRRTLRGRFLRCWRGFARLSAFLGTGMSTAASDGAQSSGRIGHMQAAARFHFYTGDSVPAAQLTQRDAEAVGDGDQCLAFANGIEQRTRRRGRGRRNGNHQSLNPSESVGTVAGGELVGRCQLRFGDAILLGHRGQGVSFGNAMVAPGIALGFGNGRDALLKQGRGSGRQMQIEGGVGRSNEMKQTGIQRNQLIDRRTHEV